MKRAAGMPCAKRVPGLRLGLHTRRPALKGVIIATNSAARGKIVAETAKSRLKSGARYAKWSECQCVLYSGAFLR